MRSGRDLAGNVAISIVLAGFAYLGLSNMRDITTTVTFGQKLVGVTATGYGLTAIVGIFAVWIRRSWLWPVTVIWAALVVTTVVAATIAYSGDLVSNLVAGLIALVLVSPIVWYARRSRRDHPATRVSTGDIHD